MGRNTEESRVKDWFKKIETANKVYKAWDEEEKTAVLEDYWQGRQWQGLSETDRDKRYTINMVFATVETNKPTLSFYRPQMRVQARPGRSSTFGSNAESRARILGDTLQTFIDDPDIHFAEETQLALHEAHFRFGVIEVGYTPDYIDNPNAGKPVLKEGKTDPNTGEGVPEVDSDGAPVLQPDKIIQHEMMYVRRIPGYRFRVSGSSVNILNQNDWVGYYEWHHVEDVKRNKNFKNTDNLKATGSLKDNLRDTTSNLPGEELERERRHGMVKIWKLWDVRTGKRCVLAENHKKFLREDIPFKFLPFSVIKFHEKLDSFYPLPPVSQWISPQDEINETRDAQRAHRRRFYRRYTRMKGAIDDTELEKLENGGDGVVAESNMPNPLVEVPLAPMGSDVWAHLDASKADLMSVTGISGDQRGVAESETATQANIIDTRARLRESSARTKVAEWLADVGRLMLLTAREYMTLPFWIQRNVDVAAVKEEAEAMKSQLMQATLVAQSTGQEVPQPPPGPAMQDVILTTKAWTEITSEEMGDFDIDVFVDMASMSPVAKEVDRNSWNQVLALMTNPGLVALMAQSEVILRKTLQLYDVTSETEIREIQKVCQMTMMAQAQAAQQAQVDDAKKGAEKAGVVPERIEAAGAEGAGGPQPEPGPGVGMIM